MDSSVAVMDAVNEFLNVESIEESFLCVIVHNTNGESQKAKKFSDDIVSYMGQLGPEEKDILVRKYIQRAATCGNLSQLSVLMETLAHLVNENVLGARILCDRILLHEKLAYENQNFWIESFKLIKKIISNVDYKGVREVMRICRDKAQTFPTNIRVSELPQMLALEETIRYIFDRNNCLLPAYFVANEIMKSYKDHWKVNKLMTDFISEFRNTAQMVSIIGHSHMLPIVEHFGYADHMMNSWKLDHNTLKFNLRGSLPYEPELLEPQTKLLRYVMDQCYSKEMVSIMLNLQKQQKQRCNVLEEQLVNLIISAMEKSENESNASVNDDTISPNEGIWLHLSSQMIYFVLFQFINFLHVVESLQEKLAKRELRKGRDQLMWILLQFISGSIQKNPITNFLPMFKLLDTLYPEHEPLKVPDINKASSLRQMAPICIWIHLIKKARLENISIVKPTPIALKLHYEYLQHLVKPNTMMSMTFGADFRVVLLCNAYSTNQEYFSRPMAILLEALNGTPKNQGVSTVVGQQFSTVPLSVVVLDSLTVHSKMSLMHSFVTQMVKLAQTKTAVPTPALIETYSRLLVYTEIESLGVKSFLVQLLPQVFKQHAWGILHTLLEMFSYRLHHIPTHYRVQLLSHLHSLSSVAHTNKLQLNLCFESTALRLITGLGSAEVQPQLSRYFNEKTPGSVASAESEELNRVLILTLARSMHITGSGNELQAWCKDLLSNIMQNTPHSWATHSLACFPPALNEFFTQNSTQHENKQLLKKSVDEEYRNWTSMSNENDIIAHFIRPTANPLFLCLLFKMIWETENISPVAYKILEGITARALSAHLRRLCDYLVFELSISNGKDFIHKCVDTINSMIWKYNVVTIDRVVLCLALRTQEGNGAQVCFLIIQLLLLKSTELRNRIQEFFKENSPDYWKQSNWHEKHLAFHQKFPEKFAPDESVSPQPLPVYFGNVCLRFLPVLDIVLHRYIELQAPNVHQILEVILDHLGCLYKFHDRPITYLYNTLHFYERNLRERPSLKKKLVSSVTGALVDVRPKNWALSEQYSQNQDLLWNPELSFYMNLMRRLSDTISGKNFFFVTDWRFNEFPNAPSHALYVTCVELLSLPVTPQIVANNLIDVIAKGYPLIPHSDIHGFINAVGIVMAALPETYWSIVYDRLHDLLTCSQMSKWSYRFSLFELCNFKTVREAMLEKTYAVLLAVAHSVFHHMGGCKLGTMAKYIKEKLVPVIKTEQQLVYLCHIFGPFLQRIEQEKVNGTAEIAIVVYELLEVVDKAHGSSPMKYMDPICDFLYHIKYIYVGNIIKNESEAIIKRLRPALQKRLRFISHFNLNMEDIPSEKCGDQQSSQTITSNCQIIQPQPQPITQLTGTQSSQATSLPPQVPQQQPSALTSPQQQSQTNTQQMPQGGQPIQLNQHQIQHHMQQQQQLQHLQQHQLQQMQQQQMHQQQQMQQIQQQQFQHQHIQQIQQQHMQQQQIQQLQQHQIQQQNMGMRHNQN